MNWFKFIKESAWVKTIANLNLDGIAKDIFNSLAQDAKRVQMENLEFWKKYGKNYVHDYLVDTLGGMRHVSMGDVSTLRNMITAEVEKLIRSKSNWKLDRVKGWVKQDPENEPVTISPVSRKRSIAQVTQEIQSIITKNKQGIRFFNVVGNTFPIKDKLSSLGFKYFKGTWGMALDKAIKLRSQIEDLGVNTSSMDVIEESKPTETSDPKIEQPQDQLQDKEKEKTNKTLEQMRKAIEEAMKSGNATSQAKAILSKVDRELDNLVQMVDETAKNEVLRAFLEFASKFYHYSFGNQILIWCQKPSATYVSGYKAWLEKGRQVTKWDESIAILAPRFFEKELTTEQLSKLSPENKKDNVKITYFIPVKVYDISSTDPIPGWKDKKGNGPFEPPKLKIDPNDKLDHITVLVEAAAKFAQSVEIKVDLEKLLPEQTGGYSMGGEVTVNKTYQGINQFGTLAHEIAHEILHRKEDQVSRTEETRQVKELDAETVAYIVLKHYGYESKSAPQYLALWRATGEQIKKRRDNIAKAVKIIIDGVNSEIEKVETEVGEEEFTTAGIFRRWVKTNCSFC